VCAILFLRPALARLLDLPGRPEDDTALLASALPANDQRQDYLRARYVEGGTGRRVEAATHQDSSMFATFAHAQALIVRPPHDPPRAAGERVAIIDLAAVLRPLG
jgi:molybdopterin molybdotransferase